MSKDKIPYTKEELDMISKAVSEVNELRKKKRKGSKSNYIKSRAHRTKTTGIFTPYYGKKFFCVNSGAIYTLKERDQVLGLNKLKLHRNSHERLAAMDRDRILRGLEPEILGDIYISDAETILLLRGYPLPHLKIELMPLSKENLEKAADRQKEIVDALRDEIAIRKSHIRILYRMKYRDIVPEATKPIRVNHPTIKTSMEAFAALRKSAKEIEKAFAEEYDVVEVKPRRKSQPTSKSFRVVRKNKDIVKAITDVLPLE